MAVTRCDLHLHSAASVGSDEWSARHHGYSETHADPVRQYDLCKSRGMSLVTFTDHDTIAGGMALLDRPDFFLSEEISATFPENGCVVHVLAWNITPAQHDEIQARRRDIYRLCDYLNGEHVAHGLAHPLSHPSFTLDTSTFEKLLLLFPVLEGVNGLTDRRIEPDLAALLDHLTPEVIATLALKHGITPNGETPHRKAFTAGSDDHVHGRCATVYAEVDGEALSPTEFVARCVAGQARLVGRPANLGTMALCVQQASQRPLKRRDPCRVGGSRGFAASLIDSVRRSCVTAGRRFDGLDLPERPCEGDDAHVVDAIARQSDEAIERAFGDLATGLQAFDVSRICRAFRDAAGGLAAGAPVFFAAEHFGRQERQARQVRQKWRASALPPRPERLAVFSDSLEEVDGVSVWCKRFVTRARAAGHEVLLPYCGGLANHIHEGGVCGSFHPLRALTGFAFPLYKRLRFYVPSLIATLQWVWRERISHVELASPGPMGLGGLLVAKTLRLPVTASYHTEVPSLVKSLGGNTLIEQAARRYVRWFYGSVDRVFAFSSGSRDTLVGLGLPPEKLSVMPMAIDPEDFSPAYRSSGVFDVLNLDVGDRPVILSVGRISEEKNLPLIVEAVGRLQGRCTPPVLVVVGEGPGRAPLEARYGRCEFVRFAGLQGGDTLKKLYASARLFVFASRVDTLGLVNMEAMASGVPVLVPSDSCIAEFVVDGTSGEYYQFGATGLAAAIARVLDDPARAARLAAEGRKAMVDRWEGTSFNDIWKSLTQQA